MGMAAVLALWIIWDCCFERHEDDYPHWKVSVLLQPAFPVSRESTPPFCVFFCSGSSDVLRYDDFDERCDAVAINTNNAHLGQIMIYNIYLEHISR